jgi:hypothetical protein
VDILISSLGFSQRWDATTLFVHCRLSNIGASGGGRPDNGLRFEECFFPIEVKHEFNSIEPRAIHENYLTQTDIYEAATNGLHF